MTIATMNKILPNSWEEKKYSIGGPVYPRWMFVHELKALLELLPDDAWLTVNQVDNLLISTDDDARYGEVDFFWTRVEVFNDDEE